MYLDQFRDLPLLLKFAESLDDHVKRHVGLRLCVEEQIDVGAVAMIPPGGEVAFPRPSDSCCDWSGVKGPDEPAEVFFEVRGDREPGAG